MSLADTQDAIGKVSKLLMDQINDLTTDLNVTVGRPGHIPSLSANNRLNIFLYEAIFDQHLKNTSLDEGQLPPIWLVLKYLLTAFGAEEQENSDSISAHEILGRGLRALHELSFLPLNAEAHNALDPNPEQLKITFDETPPDLLSKLMQGPDEKYRFSIGFQVRPVMIAAAQPPSYSLLVGVDYTDTPSQPRDNESVIINVTPSMGPTISEVIPPKFEANSTVTIKGTDLHISGLTVMLGTVELIPTFQQSDKLGFVVNSDTEAGASISAGSHPLRIAHLLPSGRKRQSNILVGDLLPILDTATFTKLADPSVFGQIELEGLSLGIVDDDIFVALYQDGQVVIMFDHEFTVQTDQKLLTLTINASDDTSDDVIAGEYNLIVRVNGLQAKNSPRITIT